MARATDAGALRALERLLGWTAGAALFAMMALTFADVVGRKLFDASIAGSLELTELLMMVMIFAALPLASLAGTHVLFDLLDRLVPAGWARAQHALAHGLCVLLLAGAAWLTFTRAARTLAQGDQTAQLGLGVAPHGEGGERSVMRLLGGQGDPKRFLAGEVDEGQVAVDLPDFLIEGPGRFRGGPEVANIQRGYSGQPGRIALLRFPQRNTAIA